VAETERQPEVPEVATKCTKCHGKQGQGRNKTPALAGIKADVFVELMRKFKSGETDSKIMAKYANSLSDEEILKLAHYFEGLAVPPPD